VKRINHASTRCLARCALSGGILLGQLAYGSAQAHPHVWVDYTDVLQGSGTQIQAVQEKWVFAKSFPVSIVIDMTHLPRSGPLDPASTAAFKTQAFNSLKSADYFTHIYVDGKPVQFGEPQQFAVAIENRKLVYTFLLPLTAPVDISHHAVELGMWDETFFVDYEPAGEAISLAPSMLATCSAQPFKDQQHPIFGGAVFPLAGRLTCGASK